MIRGWSLFESRVFTKAASSACTALTPICAGGAKAVKLCTAFWLNTLLSPSFSSVNVPFLPLQASKVL